MTQTLTYENPTNQSGQSVQSDVEVAGTGLLLSAGDITSIELSITWASQVDWQGCECYVIDPDGSYHYIFNSGSLPFGSGTRTDTLTINSASFPVSTDGTWEFYLSDQMFNTVTLDEVSVNFAVTSADMPSTYSEISWYGGGYYAGGIDLSGNGNHVYPYNSASIVADTGSGGTNAFSFSSTSSQRWSDGPISSYNNQQQWSVSAWVKPNQNIANKQMIFCNHGYTRGNFQLYQTQDEFGLFLGYFDPVASSGDSEEIETTSVNITVGQWYHVAATFDGSASPKLNFYVDDVAVSVTRTTNGTGLNVMTYNAFAGTPPDQTIGALKDATSSTIYYPFDGRIDACRTVNSVYTSSDITWLASGRDVAGGPPSFRSYFRHQPNVIGFPNA
jgi:hypothetical protein